MAPRKNRKKPEQVVSGKKRLKNGKKAAESTLEEAVSDTKTVEEKQAGDAKDSVSANVVKKKPCTWLKLDGLLPHSDKKSSPESSKQGKEVKPSTEVQPPKDNKRKRIEKDEEGGNNDTKFYEKDSRQEKKEKRKEKGEERGNNDPKFYEKHIDSRREKKEKEIAVNDRHENINNRDDEAEKVLGGLIFMCNAKTKPDCFSYRVMGVPANKKEVVMGINPGLKIFLYDYDLKLLYGVYEASSAGGMKLEPAAFGGGFPAQVRYIVHKDCHPLPENTFKKAIKDSYNERTRKFKTELTVKQVKSLIDLFSQSMVHEGNPAIRYVNNSGIAERGGRTTPHDPLFLTEQEYRSKGLRQERPLLPGERNNLDHELKHFLNNPSSNSIGPPVVQQREANQLDPLYLGEKDYRLYGLRGAPQQTLTATNAVRDYCDPYAESTTELVNRYLTMPRMTGVPEESYHAARRESYTNNLSHMILDGDRAVGSHSLHEQPVFNQRPYSLNASREPSVVSLGFHHLQRESELTSSTPVSSRYSFGGPSPSHHR